MKTPKYKCEIRCERTNAIISTVELSAEEIATQQASAQQRAPVLEFVLREPGKEPQVLRYFDISKSSLTVARSCLKRLSPQTRKPRKKKGEG